MALERGAARQVHDVVGLADAVALYLEQPSLRRAAGRAAHTLVADNRGALDRTLVFVEDALRVAVASPGETRRDTNAHPTAAVAARPRD